MKKSNSILNVSFSKRTISILIICNASRKSKGNQMSCYKITFYALSLRVHDASKEIFFILSGIFIKRKIIEWYEYTIDRETKVNQVFYWREECKKETSINIEIVFWSKNVLCSLVYLLSFLWRCNWSSNISTES